jgi:hypothetical protein
MRTIRRKCSNTKHNSITAQSYLVRHRTYGTPWTAAYSQGIARAASCRPTGTSHKLKGMYSFAPLAGAAIHQSPNSGRTPLQHMRRHRPMPGSLRGMLKSRRPDLVCQCFRRARACRRSWRQSPCPMSSSGDVATACVHERPRMAHAEACLCERAARCTWEAGHMLFELRRRTLHRQVGASHPLA